MPNRILKESTFTSDKISSLSDFEFRLWAGLITLADDAGRGDARPAVIKGRVFPLRERVTTRDVDDALHSLAAKGCVSLYTVGGKPYFWFPTWSEHQRIRDRKPKYPGPEDADPTPQPPADHDHDPPAADTGGEWPPLAANGGQRRPESNPIQSNTNPNPNQESNAHAGAREAAGSPAVENVENSHDPNNPFDWDPDKFAHMVRLYQRHHWELSDWMQRWADAHQDLLKEATHDDP